MKKGDVVLLPSGGGTQVTENAVKAELPNAFFSLSFTSKTSPQKSLAQEIRAREENFPLVTEDWLREHLGKLVIHKSIDPDGIHPWVLRQLAGITARPLMIIFGRFGRLGEASECWKKANASPKKCNKSLQKVQEGRPRALQDSQTYLNHWWKMMDYLILKAVSLHRDDKKAIRIAVMDSLKGSCAGSSWLFSTAKQLLGWMKGDQWILSTLI